MFRGQNFIRMCVVNKSNQRQNTTAQELFHLHKDHGLPPPPPSLLSVHYSLGKSKNHKEEKADFFRGENMKLKKGQWR